MRSKFGSAPDASTGLAGPFRAAEQTQTRYLYLSILKVTFELAFLCGAVGVHFYSITQDYGDYGAIQMWKLLRPTIEILKAKVRKLKEQVALFHKCIEEELLLAPVRN